MGSEDTNLRHEGLQGGATSAPPPLRHAVFVTPVGTVTAAILAGLAVFGTAAGQYLLDLVHPSCVLIAAPTAVALAAFFLGGYRVAAGVCLGGIGGGLVAGLPPLHAVLAGLALTSIGAVVWPFQRLGIRLPLERIRDVLWFLLLGPGLATVLSTALTLGVGCAFGTESWNRFGLDFVLWWEGTMLAAITLSPALLAWCLPDTVPVPSLPRWEPWLLWFLLTVTLLLVFGGALAPLQGYGVLATLPLPFLIWAAFRQGARYSTLAVCLLAVVCVWSSVSGVGIFAGRTPEKAVVLKFVYCGTASVGTLIAAAAAAERQRALAALGASEARFRQMTETIREVFWLMDWRERRLIYVSPAHRELWGESSENFVQAQHAWRAGLHPEDRERVLGSFERLAETGTWEETYRIVRRDGTSRWVRDRAFPIREGGVIVRVAGVAEDITDQMALEDRVRQSEKMESLGTLTRGIAHDFNNILGPILGHAELLQRRVGETDAGTSASLATVRASAERARELIQQIMTFGRDQHGANKAVNVARAVDEALDMIREELPAKVTVTREFPAAVPPVWADPSQIHQVVMNLLKNAIQAMEERGGVLRVSVKARASESEHGGTEVVLAVEDTGCGIPEALLPRVFDPFFSTKAPGKGSGLGLSVVHGVVSRAGGSVQVASREGHGSVFTVVLPACPSESERARASERRGQISDRREGVLAGAATGDSCRVAVVDDDEAMREVLHDMLEALGHRPTKFENAADALRWIREDTTRVDLVITDESMPEMRGTVLAAELHRLRPSLPVLLCTGHNDTEDVATQRKSGVRQVLTKPVSLAELEEAVRSAASDRKKKAESVPPAPGTPS